MVELFENENKGAIISDCEMYRYQLWRTWNDDLPKVMFIMLNPSIADASIDDPTIRRCISFAKSWGFGGLFVGNLYAYRATNPKELKTVIEPIGKFNCAHIVSMASRSEMIVCAWGNNEKPHDYILCLKNLHYLELSIHGIPKHPLYLKSNLKPKKYDSTAI